MTKLEILTLVQELSRNRAEAATIGTYYDETIDRIAREADVLIDCELIAMVAGTNEYVFPDKCVRPVAVFYNDKELCRSTWQELESIKGKTWKAATGTPSVYGVDLAIEKEPNTFRLYPTPTNNSDDFIFLFGAPFGEDYPDYACAALYASSNFADNEDTIPDWLALAIAHEVLWREFVRPSPKQDETYAEACLALAQWLYAYVGVEFKVE